MACAASLLRVFLVVAACLLPATLHAEPEHPVKPLLWKVEGPGVEKPAYLFGTIHIGKTAAAKLHPAADKAFKQATVLHTEAPFDPATQTASIGMLTRTDGKELAESIGPDLSKRVAEELKHINDELDSTPFQTVKTWYVAYMLPMLPYMLDGAKPLDMALWDRAEKAKKKTSGMQTPEEQAIGFEELTEEEQTTLLKNTLAMMKKYRVERKDPMAELVTAYISGDIERIDAQATKSIEETFHGEDKALGERLLKSILTDRDAIMTDYIDATLKKSPAQVHFFAAGAAHYTGKESVRARLERRGYKVTRIEE
ncbi:TraB/GumN family protein [Luteolibacter sp. GHJ8]|uniref:TraB/GumN family protein n=1 Tax=Luteolibacter rhizosphaerae TaxID=2989719 RepID=A0ABT3G3X9_9BACT|nr:TraB/GumN family protein [Luteolibacter rhizosphaerae]MCW1914542.1 TraB/GumN family protein [Luteolibacter rhizosphaerae]